MAHPLNTYSDAVERLLRAGEAILAAYGGDTPDWLRDEAGTLADACRDMRRAAIPLDRYIGSADAPAPAKHVRNVVLAKMETTIGVDEPARGAFDDDGSYWPGNGLGYSCGTINMPDDMEEEAATHKWSVVRRDQANGRIYVTRA
jgi:hypothetical protein